MYKKYKKELELAEAKYHDLEKSTKKLLQDTIKKSVRTEITDGYKYNITPFQNERYGFKINGKTIAKEIVKNSCIKYYFDEQDKIILQENMAVSLKKFHNRTIYLHEENCLLIIRLVGTDLNSINICTLVSEQVIKSIGFAQYGVSVNLYEYSDNQLQQIIVYNKEHNATYEHCPTEQFHYDKNGKLECIIETFSSGDTRIRYSTKKINYKKLTARLETELASNVKDFLNKLSSDVTQDDVYYDEEDVTVIGFTCQPAHQCLDVAMHTDEFEEYLNPADFTYKIVCSLDLINRPLDDEEERKIVLASVNAINNFTRSDVFKSIPKAEEFCATIFYYDLEHYEKENDDVKKILKDNPYFNCESDDK